MKYCVKWGLNQAFYESTDPDFMKRLYGSVDEYFHNDKLFSILKILASKKYFLNFFSCGPCISMEEMWNNNWFFRAATMLLWGFISSSPHLFLLISARSICQWNIYLQGLFPRLNIMCSICNLITRKNHNCFIQHIFVFNYILKSIKITTLLKIS